MSVEPQENWSPQLHSACTETFEKKRGVFPRRFISSKLGRHHTVWANVWWLGFHLSHFVMRGKEQENPRLLYYLAYNFLLPPLPIPVLLENFGLCGFDNACDIDKLLKNIVSSCFPPQFESSIHLDHSRNLNRAFTSFLSNPLYSTRTFLLSTLTLQLIMSF